MSGPNNPPSAAATARLSVTQGGNTINLKRSVQADFDGERLDLLFTLACPNDYPSALYFHCLSMIKGILAMLEVFSHI